MAFTTETSTTTTTYSWTDNPDFTATAETVLADDGTLTLKSLKVANPEGTSIVFFGGTGVEVDFVTFLKGVVTDLETELTPLL
jgi:hypothetical protein